MKGIVYHRWSEIRARNSKGTACFRHSAATLRSYQRRFWVTRTSWTATWCTACRRHITYATCSPTTRTTTATYSLRNPTSRCTWVGKTLWHFIVPTLSSFHFVNTFLLPTVPFSAWKLSSWIINVLNVLGRAFRRNERMILLVSL